MTKTIVCSWIWLLILGSATLCHAYTDDQAIKAIIGEAEGETYEGKLAVACAIRNRGTLQGVYGAKAPRVKHHKYSADIAREAKDTWKASENSDLCSALIDGAQFWASIKLDKDWSAKMRRSGYRETAKIGGHIFYRK